MSKVERRKASIREFGTREIRYADYRHGVVGEVTFRFLSNLAQKNTVSYPELTLSYVRVLMTDWGVNDVVIGI